MGIQFANLGIHSSNTYYVARDHNLVRTLVGNSLVVAVGSGGSAVAVIYLLLFWFPEISSIDGFMLALAVIWIPLGLLYLLLQNLMIGIGRIRFYNVTELITKVLYTLGIVLLVFIGQVQVTVVYLIVILTGIIGIIALLWRLVGSFGTPRLSLSVFRGSISYGLRAYFVALFSFLVIRIDLLMVEHYLGLDAAGYYSIAVTMADYLYMIPVVVGTILFPKLSGMNNMRDKWLFTKRLTYLFIPMMILLSVIAMALAKPTISILFGDEFIPSVIPFIWLVPAILFLSINTVFMNYFASLGMPMIALYSTILATASNVVLNFWLIPERGMVGASISSIAAYGMMLAVSILYILVNRPREGQAVNREENDNHTL